MIKYIHIYMGVFALTLLSGETFAVDMEKGRSMYEQHCTRCHNEEVFQRPQRLVNSEKQLIERIKQCELSNELTWFEEEIEDVAAYLAKEFYKFPNGEL